MSLFHKSLKDIEETDLDALVKNQVIESRLIEYKRVDNKIDLSTQKQTGKSFSPKVEFLLDVCQFANSEGGDILFGIEQDKNGAASMVRGFLVESKDELERRLNSVITTGIKPQIRYEFHWIDLKGKQERVLIIRIFPSWNPPHQVWNEYPLFATRISGHRGWFDVDTLRQAFVGSETISERIRQFRFKRIDEILSGRGPRIVLGAEPTITDNWGDRHSLTVLHIMPVISFSQQISLNMESISQTKALHDLKNPDQPDKMNFHGPYFTLDGLSLGYVGYGTPRNPDTAYINLFQNGAFEVCISIRAVLRLESFRDDAAKTALVKFSPEINDLLGRILKFHDKLGECPPPYCIAFSLLNCLGVGFLGPGRFRDLEPSKPLVRDHIILPEQLIKEIPQDPVECLIPFYDRLWQAVGIVAAPKDWVR